MLRGRLKKVARQEEKGEGGGGGGERENQTLGKGGEN